MWKLQALGSLPVLLNVVFGHLCVACPSLAALQLSCMPNQLPCGRHIPERGGGFHQAQGCGWALGRVRAQQSIPLPRSGALLAPTAFLKVGASKSRLSWQVHGSFRTSIIDKQWWEEIHALSCGRIVAKHLYSLWAGQVCEQRPCTQERQVIYRKMGLKSSKGSLKAG